jgi:membrane-associated protein
VLGDNLGYFIGRRVGAPLLVWLERQRRFRFISPRTLARGRAYFRRRTAWAVFISRFLIVALGGPINLLAGVERYPYRNFLFWDVSGQILGAIIPLGLGYVFAASWEQVAGVFGAFSSLFLVLLVAIILSVLLVRRIGQSTAASTVKDEANDAVPPSESKIGNDALPPLQSKTGHNTGPLPIHD